jgi:serine phosphatase RsbU (regulator of sigma subunit)
MRNVLLGTWPGRLLIAALAARLASLAATTALGRAPAVVSTLDTVAAAVIAGAVVYLLARGAAVMKRRLLWRVRRKLIISYVFIGFVPALLLCAFFALGGILLFYNFGAYLVRSEFAAAAARAQTAAALTAADVDAAPAAAGGAAARRREAEAGDAFPGATVRIVPVDDRCVGAALPGWLGCRTFTGLLKEPPFLQRAVAFTGPALPRYAVIVDLPLGEAYRGRVRQATGIELGLSPATAASPPLTSFAYLERVDWATGRPETFQLGIRIAIREMYDRISVGPGLDGTRNVVIILLGLVGGLFLIIEIAALAAGGSLARSITGSVHALFQGTERVQQEDFTHQIAVGSDDQLGQLGHSFNSMTATIRDLLRQMREKERLEQELRIAREIQMSLLPAGPLEMAGLSVSARCVPAREVGGDYYDFVVLDEHRLGLIVADVSGKGASAALYMAELKGVVASLSRIHSSPRELLVQANRVIAEHLDARRFITVAYAIVDLRDRTMKYSRAGHTPLIYLAGPAEPATGKRPVSVSVPDGLVLGLNVDDGGLFERLLGEETIHLHAGDLYCFFTDGITEAMNEADDLFGEDRLAELIRASDRLDGDVICERVLEEVRAFSGGAGQHDDMTMVVLKIGAAGQASRTMAAGHAGHEARG